MYGSCYRKIDGIITLKENKTVHIFIRLQILIIQQQIKIWMLLMKKI